MLRGLQLAACCTALLQQPSIRQPTAQKVATVDLTDLLRDARAAAPRSEGSRPSSTVMKAASDKSTTRYTRPPDTSPRAVVEPLATAWPGLRIVVDVGAAADGAVCAAPHRGPASTSPAARSPRRFEEIRLDSAGGTARDIVEASLERVIG